MLQLIHGIIKIKVVNLKFQFLNEFNCFNSRDFESILEPLEHFVVSRNMITIPLPNLPCKFSESEFSSLVRSAHATARARQNFRSYFYLGLYRLMLIILSEIRFHPFLDCWVRQMIWTTPPSRSVIKHSCLSLVTSVSTYIIKVSFK